MNEETNEQIRASLAANVLRLGNECRDLAAENARLKADFSQMTAWGRGLESDLSRARVELMLVKAEVERLKGLNATLSLRYDATKSMLDGCAKEIEEMEAEAERLKRLLPSEDDTNRGGFNP